jgi:uncharacterized protein involved in outer membrane biogenesis
MQERAPPPVPWLRFVLLGLLAVVLALVGAIGLIRALIDTGALHAQAEAALRQATGRDVTIGGRLTIESYFGATVAVEDVVIPNLPGASRPDLARIERIEAELSLLSLLSGTPEIQRLVIAGPDIALEIDAEGRGNWQNPPPESAAPPASGVTMPPTLPRSFHLRDGRLSFADARAGRRTELVLRRISLTDSEGGGLQTLVADLAYGDQRISANGQIGPLARLVDRDASSAWPVRVVMESAGARLTVAGGFTSPLDLAGYALKVDAWVADTSTLAGLIPYRLPVVRTLSITARIADVGGTIPDIAGARVEIGASDLSAWVPGLKLDTAEIVMPGLEQSLRGEFLGTLNGVPVRLVAALGGLSVFLPERAEETAPFPIDIAAEAGETKIALKGGIGAAGARRDLDLALSARIRDLEFLSPLAGTRLPRLRDLAVDVRLTDGDPQSGFAESLALRGLALSVPQGDLAGELLLHHAPRWGLEGRVTSSVLDADALAGILATSLGSIDLVERTPLLHRRRSLTDLKVIPDTKLRLDPLRHADLDLTLALAELRAMGIELRGLAGRVRLHDGRLAIDPLIADVPGGRAALRLTVDAADPRVPMSLRATIPGIPVQPLLASSTRRDNLFGPLEIDADLTAEGDTIRALAATVSGRLGLSIVEGDIDSRVLLDPLAGVMGAARVPLNLATQMGTLSRLRCFALRLDAERGKTAMNGFLIESGRVLIDGGGGFDLGEEEWALRLRSAIRLPGQAVSVPSRLLGSFLTPRMVLDTPDPARGAAIARPDAPDYCIPALELARAGRPGAMPSDRGARPSLVVPPRRPQR